MVPAVEVPIILIVLSDECGSHDLVADAHLGLFISEYVSHAVV